MSAIILTHVALLWREIYTRAREKKKYRINVLNMT